MAPKDRGFDAIHVADLTGVIYSSAKVFDGLRTGRLDTGEFLRSGSTRGLTSKHDLMLLEDLRDVAQFVIDHRGEPVDAAFARKINSTITRSGSLHPGKYRADKHDITVMTDYGVHAPKGVDEAGLQKIFDQHQGRDIRDRAVHLFVDIAKAQPFWDGNKRTALFVANAELLNDPKNELMVVPFRENDPDVARRFNDLLARAYIYDEYDGVTQMLHEQGFQKLRPTPYSFGDAGLDTNQPAAITSPPVENHGNPAVQARIQQLTEKLNRRAAEIDPGDTQPESHQP